MKRAYQEFLIRALVGFLTGVARVFRRW